MLKILIIDDELDRSKVMISLIKELNKLGHSITMCYNIDKAKAYVRQKIFDCIILDIMMHYGDDYNYENTKGGIDTGYVFLRDFKNGEFGDKNMETLLIIYTNRTSIDFKKNIENEIEGIYFIFKPFKKEMLDIILDYKEGKK